MTSTSDAPGALFRRVRAACVIGALFAGTAAGQEITGRITGFVHDVGGTPASGAVIILRGPVAGELHAGADGRFQSEPLPDGTYSVTATVPGFSPVTREVQLAGGGNAEVALILLPLVLEQVTVSGAKMGDRDLQKVPIAVSVLASDELTRTEAHTLRDWTGMAPGLTVTQNTGFSQVTIRGIGSNVVFTGSDPSSAVYVDGVYIARPAAVLMESLDLERVELVRGPQGTLYGHNAVGGALNLTTKAPDNELAFSARVVGGNFRTARTQVSVSGPIAGGRILAGASALGVTTGGYVEDLDHPDDPLGGTEVAAGRAAVRVLFNGRTELRLAGDYTIADPTPLTYSKVLAVKPGFTVDNPADPHQVRTSDAARGRSIHRGASAQLIWRPGPGTVATSLSAVRDLDYDVRVDNDATELHLSVSRAHEIHRQVSQEFTMTGEGRGLTWTTGLFLFKDVDRQPTTIELPSAGRINSLNPRVEGSIVAAFVQTSVPLGSRVAAIIGVRYSRERKAIENAGASSAGGVALASFQYRESRSASVWTPKLGLEYEIDDRMLGYVSATRGYKSGGFNITAPEPRGGFAPEFAWTYEVGIKALAWSQRARLNGAVYFTDYTDLQVQTPIRPGVIDIRNAATARIRGLELEADLQPVPHWRVGGHAAWTDARYDRYLALGPGGTSVDAAGKRLFNTPEYSGRAWVEHARQLGAAGSVSLLVEAVMQTTVYFTPLNDPIERQGAYGLVNVNLTLRPRGWWSVGLYARNLTDTEYVTGTSSVPPPAIAGHPAEPRRFGVQFTVSRR